MTALKWIHAATTLALGAALLGMCHAETERTATISVLHIEQSRLESELHKTQKALAEAERDKRTAEKEWERIQREAASERERMSRDKAIEAAQEPDAQRIGRDLVGHTLVKVGFWSTTEISVTEPVQAQILHRRGSGKSRLYRVAFFVKDGSELHPVEAVVTYVSGAEGWKLTKCQIA